MVKVVKSIQQKLKQLNKWWLSKLVKVKSNPEGEKNEIRKEEETTAQTQTKVLETNTKVLDAKPKRRRKKRNDS